MNKVCNLHFSILCRKLHIMFCPKIWEIASFIINLEQIYNTKVRSVLMRSGEIWYNSPVPSSPEGSLGPDYDAYISVFLGNTIIHWLYKLTISDQAQATMQLTVILSNLIRRFLACLPLLGAPKKFFTMAWTHSWRPC